MKIDLSQYTVGDIPALFAVIDDLKRLIAELHAENTQLKAQIAELTSQLNQNSRNSSPSLDGRVSATSDTAKEG